MSHGSETNSTSCRGARYTPEGLENLLEHGGYLAVVPVQ